jgi:glycosyltransferase involved in cell wall biosynthesis
MRLAWFSPMPPVATGIARCSADLVGRLQDEHEIDVFVAGANLPARRGPARGPQLQSAHDFVWRHHTSPYDLVVYQMGNSSHHDYEWPYLFRYPGLVVLHDAHLHHARAACLLRTFRADDYRREFRANHPDVSPDLAELAVAGFDSHQYYAWPMTKLLVERSRRVAVHTEALAEWLRRESPAASIEAIRLGHGVALADEEAARARTAMRTRLCIPDDAIVFGCYGGLTPDKRVPQILEAFAAVRASMPAGRLLLAGSLAPHCDVRGIVERLGVGDGVTITGYLDTDEDLTAAIAACDVAVNLRWPTAREVSGPWLRCLAAGRPTITIDLAHATRVPSIDPRTWAPNQAAEQPCTVAIDIVDEDHSLRVAMRRLASDADLRERLGAAARQYWHRHHSIDAMIDDYRGLIARAAESPAPPAALESLPRHLRDTGAGTLRAVMDQFGVAAPFSLEGLS